MMPLIGYDADSESSEIAENSSTASDDSGRTTESTQRSNSSAASLLMAHHVQQGMPRLGDAPRQIDAGLFLNIQSSNEIEKSLECLSNAKYRHEHATNEMSE
uniref:Uncharacterized protein n=1 Tax=Glossina austeni TaxID=7395 RepID=A0A1A9VW96_GLOAU